MGEREKGYVYALKGSPEALTDRAAALGEPLVHWTVDGARFLMGAGVPADWKEQGALFGPQGELRWWREGEQHRALLLTDHPIEGLRPVAGEWTVDLQEVDLQDLAEPRVKPNFERYPHGLTKGRLEIRVYYRDGTPVFISPRRLKE